MARLGRSQPFKPLILRVRGTMSFSTVLTEVVTVVDTVAKETGRLFSEVIAILDSNATLKIKIVTLSEVITIVDSFVKTIGRGLTEIITVVDTIAKTIGKVLSEVLTVVDTALVAYSIAAKGFLRGLNKDTNTSIGTRKNSIIGLNKDTNTGIGTRKM